MCSILTAVARWRKSLKKGIHPPGNLSEYIRSEFYNLFNRAQCGQPVNGITSGLFGLFLSQVGRPNGTSGARQIQFATKIIF